MKDLSRLIGTVLLVILVAAPVMGFISLVKPTAHAGVSGVSEDTATQARELWEKALAAKGGRERLRKIKNLYVAADQGRGDRYLEFTVFPDYHFGLGYDASRELTVVEVTNATKDISWWQPQGHDNNPRKYNDDDAYEILLPQFLYLMVSHYLDPVPLRVRKQWMGLKRVEVVETDANGWRIDYYLDSKTHLPVRVVLPLGPRERAKGTMDHIVTLSDYAAVDGVLMPHKATHAFTFNSPRKGTDLLTFEINADYDPEIFEKGPTDKTGAYAWRAKK